MLVGRMGVGVMLLSLERSCECVEPKKDLKGKHRERSGRNVNVTVV
jgi:hypothetical protein